MFVFSFSQVLYSSMKFPSISLNPTSSTLPNGFYNDYVLDKYQINLIQLGHILDLYCVRLSNAAPFCENYAKLYFDAKHLEKGLNRGEGREGGQALFHKKVLLLSNIERCPKFLEYTLTVPSSQKHRYNISGIFSFKYLLIQICNTMQQFMILNTYINTYINYIFY